jgi:hypothetical protein
MRRGAAGIHAAGAALLALAALLPLAGDVLGQAQPGTTTTLVVRVLDDATGRPVAGAQVTVSGAGVGASTDRKGTVRLEGIPPGGRTVTVSSLGYAADSVQVAFEAGTPVQAELRLAPQPVSLKGIIAAGEPGDRALLANGFYQRARLGGATFIAGERLAGVARKTNRLTSALENVPGLHVVPNKHGTGMILVSTRGVVSFNKQCYPIVYLDGIRANYDVTRGGSSKGGFDSMSDDADLNQLMPLNDVAGIEVYQGAANVPYEYERNPCGVVLVWTKRGG